MTDLLIILWTLFRPGNLVLWLLLAAVVLLLAGRRRIAVWLLATEIFLLLGLTFFPIAETAFEALEERFPPAACMPETMDGIVVLGGSMDIRASYRWQRPALNHRAERLITGADLARHYPKAKLLFTGGPSRRNGIFMNEADVARMVFAELGLPPDRAI